LTTKTDFFGTWRILSTDLWVGEDLDLVEPAHITIKRGGKGDLVLGAVNATLDWTVRLQHLEFTLHGFDDDTEISGHGYAQLENAEDLSGRILFHKGDNTSFRAKIE
jgi:hypothetical protein